MQVKPINNNTNFYGYKNVILNICKSPNGPETFGFIAMQLDNIGRKDLATWHTIQKNFLQRETLKDTITFEFFKEDGNADFLLSNYLLKVPKNKIGTELEKFMLKAYTLMAALTNDIKFGEPNYYDKDFSKTLHDAKDDILPVFDNDEAFVNEFLLTGVTAFSAHKEGANFINNEIQKEMNNHFEV